MLLNKLRLPSYGFSRNSQLLNTVSCTFSLLGFVQTALKITANKTTIFTPLNEVRPSLTQFSQNSQLVNGVTLRSITDFVASSE
jgi:hypothetical protein